MAKDLDCPKAILAALLLVAVRSAEAAQPLSPPEVSGQSLAVPPAEPSPCTRDSSSDPDGTREAGSVPDEATLEANGAVIGEILIRAKDIFDTEIPEEDRAAFRFANRIHRKTREGVIRKQLLFESGDLYSRRVLEESERLLRGSPYLYEASIRPVRYQQNQVDVEVVTRDVWTLTFALGFSRSGGVNSTRFGLEDGNFLGLGKEVTVRRTSNVDRTSLLYRYRDPNLLGTRGKIALAYQDQSDGSSRSIALERPFFSLDARWALGLGAASEDRVDSLYSRGEITDRFRHRRSYLDGSGGLCRGLVGKRALRFTMGFTFERDRFEAAAGFPPPSLVPPGRTLVYPWVGLDRVEDAFIEARDLDRIQRTEDLNLGRQLKARVGYAARSFGSDRDALVFGTSLVAGSNPGHAQLLFVSAQASGRWASGGVENLVVGGAVRYFVRDLGDHILYATLSADAASRLDPERQLLLGGDNGLRGYPLRFQDGDRRVLLTLEQRFYTNWHLFRLVHVGAAVFFDAGRAWHAGSRGADEEGVLKDVGVGLRLGSSRSSKGALVHLDVAVPLDGGGTVRKTQFLVKSHDTF